MGLTPDVAPGGLIQSAWGNEIRNRTIQAFATVAERDSAWTSPPTGAFCVTLDTRTLWVRQPTSWQKVPARGRNTATTNANGEITVTHGMGVAPTVVVGTPSSATFFMIIDASTFTSTTFKIQCTTAPGNIAANTALGFHWVAYP